VTTLSEREKVHGLQRPRNLRITDRRHELEYQAA
jgi:hypothetical protein